MSSNTQPTAAGLPNTGMRKEIEAKWGKFSAQEIAGLKDKDELVALVQSRYQLDKMQAQKDVDAFAKGRPL